MDSQVVMQLVHGRLLIVDIENTVRAVCILDAYHGKVVVADGVILHDDVIAIQVENDSHGVFITQQVGVTVVFNDEPVAVEAGVMVGVDGRFRGLIGRVPVGVAPGQVDCAVGIQGGGVRNGRI